MSNTFSTNHTPNDENFNMISLNSQTRNVVRVVTEGSYWSERCDDSPYDKRVNELNEESTKAEQPKELKNIKLYDHQLTMIARASEIESTNKIPFEDISFSEQTSVTNNQYYFHNHIHRDKYFKDDEIYTKMGIIADKTGAGKSLEIIGIILNKPFINNENIVTKSENIDVSSSQSLVKIKKHHHVRNISANLIIVPIGISKQWRNYMKEHVDSSIPCEYITSMKDLTKIDTIDKLKSSIDGKYFVFISSSMFGKFGRIVEDYKLNFSRIIYDEIDNVNLPSNKELLASFYWFVSASYGNLLYPQGHSYAVPLSQSHTSTVASHYGQTRQITVTHKRIRDVYGFKNIGFIKRVFNNFHNTGLLRTLIIKNADSYVDSSIQLPDYKEIIVLSKITRTVNILSGHVDQNIITALNAGDTEAAINLLNPDNVQKGVQIVQVFTNQLHDELNNKKIELDSVKRMIMNEDTKKERIERIENQINEINSKITDIEIRLTEENACSICMDEVENKTVTKCGHVYCFTCIMTWMTQGRSEVKCPMCRTNIDINSINVIDDNKEEKEEEEIDLITWDDNFEIGTIPILDSNSSFDNNFSKITKYYSEKKNTEEKDKIENLKDIMNVLKTDSKSRILIFSQYDRIFRDSQIELNRMNIPFGFIRGTSNTINKRIEQFKSGEIKVLFADPTYYGSGLNMEMTSDIIICHKLDSDIERQVIGRAHRVGRKDPLRVWYLVNSSEDL